MTFHMIHPYIALIGGVWVTSALAFAGIALLRLRHPRSVVLWIGMWGSGLAWGLALVGLMMLAAFGDSVYSTNMPDIEPERLEMPSWYH